MSILNRPTKGQPSVLIALAKTLWGSEGLCLPSDRLLNRAAPASLYDPKQAQAQARGALNTWLKLGLFTETKDGAISFATDVFKQNRLKLQSLLWLRGAAREVAFRPQNNDPFWASKHSSEKDEDAGDGHASDLSRGAAWLLAQNHDSRLTSYEEAQELASSQIGNFQLILQNNTRWTPLVDWMFFLGLGIAGATEGGGQTLIVDPAEAISDLLPAIFCEGAVQLSQGDFLTRLGEHLPVIDGGSYRNALEKKMTASWSGPAKGCLSPTLSRALLRLDSDRKIQLIEKADAGHGQSDAGSVPIELWFGAKETRKFTHIALQKGCK